MKKLKTVLFDTTASSPGDYVRVLTAFSPAAAVQEPSSVASLGSGLAGLAALLGRKKLPQSSS